MDIRNVMQPLGTLIAGLSILWVGLGVTFGIIGAIRSWLSPGIESAWADPAASLAWGYAVPGLVGVLLGLIVAEVGRRNA